jgi:hypothetical protein
MCTVNKYLKKYNVYCKEIVKRNTSKEKTQGQFEKK